MSKFERSGANTCSSHMIRKKNVQNATRSFGFVYRCFWRTIRKNKHVKLDLFWFIMDCKPWLIIEPNSMPKIKIIKVKAYLILVMAWLDLTHDLSMRKTLISIILKYYTHFQCLNTRSTIRAWINWNTSIFFVFYHRVSIVTSMEHQVSGWNCEIKHHFWKRTYLF